MTDNPGVKRTAWGPVAFPPVLLGTAADARSTETDRAAAGDRHYDAVGASAANPILVVADDVQVAVWPNVSVTCHDTFVGSRNSLVNESKGSITVTSDRCDNPVRANPADAITATVRNIEAAVRAKTDSSWTRDSGLGRRSPVATIPRGAVPGYSLDDSIRSYSADFSISPVGDVDASIGADSNVSWAVQQRFLRGPAGAGPGDIQLVARGEPWLACLTTVRNFPADRHGGGGAYEKGPSRDFLLTHAVLFHTFPFGCCPRLRTPSCHPERQAWTHPFLNAEKFILEHPQGNCASHVSRSSWASHPLCPDGGLQPLLKLKRPQEASSEVQPPQREVQHRSKRNPGQIRYKK